MIGGGLGTGAHGPRSRWVDKRSRRKARDGPTIQRPVACGGRADVSISDLVSSLEWDGEWTRRSREETEMKFEINEAPIDRAVRIVLGIALAGLALGGAITAPLLYGAWVVAAILVVTGIVGFCPLYALLRVSTKSKAR